MPSTTKQNASRRLSPGKRGFNTQEFDKSRKTPLGVFTFKQFNKNEDTFKYAS